MKVFSYSEARQNFASVLNTAQLEGEVCIRRRDGQSFVLTPSKNKRSPLDVKGIDIDISTDEIVGLVREGRERV